MTTMAFPFAVTPSGQVATVTDENEALLQQVQFTVSTTMGTRAMRPTFGTTLPAQVFESLDDVGQDMSDSIRAALTHSIPAANIHEVSTAIDDNTSTLEVVIMVSRKVEYEARPLTVTMTFGRVAEDSL